MQKTTENYQDIFLNQARRERTMLTVFLMNGFQMRGVITGFDQFVYHDARSPRSPDAELSCCSVLREGAV